MSPDVFEHADQLQEVVADWQVAAATRSDCQHCQNQMLSDEVEQTPMRQVLLTTMCCPVAKKKELARWLHKGKAWLQLCTQGKY